MKFHTTAIFIANGNKATGAKGFQKNRGVFVAIRTTYRKLLETVLLKKADTLTKSSGYQASRFSIKTSTA